jgi:hypothetical protein
MENEAECVQVGTASLCEYLKQLLLGTLLENVYMNIFGDARGRE